MCLPAALLCALGPFVSTAAFASVLPSPPQAAVDAAKAAGLIRFHRLITGGAYTNGAWSGGASILLAVASHTGNTSADARLLEQIRYTLIGENTICANGGYPSQHERHVTGMFAIVKKIPRIWDQLSATEKTRVDLLMKAALVASAFTTSNHNPYVLAGTQQFTLNADWNINRDWGPNYREGMLGGMLVGMVYFGGPAAATAVLNTYNHSEFVAELSSHGLTNTHEIFNWKVANPATAAPTGTMIQNAVKNYQYYQFTLADYLGIYQRLVNDTYEGHVNSGLNGGAGVNGAGKIYAGAANLPNPGALGMLKEFDTLDGGGKRSSLVYCYDGYRPHQTNQLVLIIGGYWPKGSALANAAVARLKIGNNDMMYKIQQGYIDYSNGGSGGMVGTAFSSQRGLPYVWPLWQDVLLPYHEAAPDSDGDGTDDATELRLGLDPADAASRYAATLVDGMLRWPSASGLTFDIQRSVSHNGMDWQHIATVSGTAGLASFTDLAPPAGRAFYRVGLRP